MLKSWAIPKGPSLNPADKRLAMPTEDHPMEYAKFEGVIPEGYGAGTVMVWDIGFCRSVKKRPGGKLLSLEETYRRGIMDFHLRGFKLHGRFVLVRSKGATQAGAGRESWLFFKVKDRYADPNGNITRTAANSALTGRSLAQIKKEESGPGAGKSQWKSNK